MRDEVTFTIYQKENLLRHTGIAIKVNGTIDQTIDFGTSLGYENTKGDHKATLKKWRQYVFAALNIPVESRIAINYSLETENKELVELKTFWVSKPEEAEDVKAMIRQLRNIPMGDYQLLKNNCRDYVTKAADIILPASGAEIAFNLLQKTRIQDDVLYDGVWSLLCSIIILVIFVIITLVYRKWRENEKSASYGRTFWDNVR